MRRGKGIEKGRKEKKQRDGESKQVIIRVNVWADGRAVVIKGRKPMVWAYSGMAGDSHTPSVNF